MGRVTSLTFAFLVVAVAAATTVAAHDDWLPHWGDSPPDGASPPLYPSPPTDPGTPSPYYDAPPYGSPDPTAPPPADCPPLANSKVVIEGKSPMYSPTDAPSYTFAPSYEVAHWLTVSMEENPDQWPEPYSATTTVEEAFGPDAESVYGSLSLLDGLSSKGDDGYSKLIKCAIQALLNCIDKHFKYAEDEIKKVFSFKSALASEESAALQAQQFQEANDEYAAGHS